MVRKLSIKSLLDLKVEAAVNPSEDQHKVIDAIGNVIPHFLLEVSYRSRIVGKATGSESLATIFEQVRSRAAMGVLRRILLDNRAGDSTWFLLNKQAASVGIAVFIEDDQESPLGPIRVTIRCEELDTVIDWLVPKR
ncbi:MAG TPA: RNA-binding domain-containing protein [Nitrososphaera sp.]